MASPPTVDLQPRPEPGQLQPGPSVRAAPTEDDWRELQRRAADARRAARDLRNRSVELRTTTIGKRTVTWNGYWLKP